MLSDLSLWTSCFLLHLTLSSSKDKSFLVSDPFGIEGILLLVLTQIRVPPRSLSEGQEAIDLKRSSPNPLFDENDGKVP